MRDWRERKRADGLNECVAWVPAERMGELQAIAQHWRREAGLLLASDLPSVGLAQAPNRSRKAQRRPVPLDGTQGQAVEKT